MLLLVTIGLVLVGAVSLVIGFISNALGWIYLSIFCSIVAAGVLVLFSRMSRQAPAAAGAGPGPIPESGEPTVATAAVGAAEPPTAPVVVPEAAAAVVAFPIADYDSLKVNEIVPKLSGLDLDQLDVVREREEGGKNRATVVSRIDDLIDQLEAADAAAEAAGAGVAGAGAELAAVEVGASTGAATAVTTGVGEELDNIDDLIEDYDKLSVNQILPLLGELDEDELEDVAAYEEDHKDRASILDRIDQLLEGEEPAATAAPAKKAVAKKAVAKKAATQAKKVVAKKAAAPASAKKAPAPAKAAAPAKKVAAPAKKAAAPAKKAAAGTAKKAAAAPAKKAVKAAKTTKKATKAAKR